MAFAFRGTRCGAALHRGGGAGGAGGWLFRQLFVCRFRLGLGAVQTRFVRPGFLDRGVGGAGDPAGHADIERPACLQGCGVACAERGLSGRFGRVFGFPLVACAPSGADPHGDAVRFVECGRGWVGVVAVPGSSGPTGRVAAALLRGGAGAGSRHGFGGKPDPLGGGEHLRR